MSRSIAVAFMSALFVLSSGAEPAKGYPPADSGYQDYAEMVTIIEQIAASKPSSGGFMRSADDPRGERV